MNTWYLVALKIHLFWPGFLENFLVLCSLQKFQMKSSKCMIDHRQIEATIEQSLIIKMEEKSYCSSVSMVWLHGYRDYRGSSKQSSWRYWPKKVVHFDKKLMLIEGCWSTPSNLLPNYLWMTYLEISKQNYSYLYK